MYSIVGIEDGHLASKNHQIYLIFKKREGKETDKDKIVCILGRAKNIFQYS